MIPATGPSAPPMTLSTLNTRSASSNHSHGTKTMAITVEITPALTKFSRRGNRLTRS